MKLMIEHIDYDSLDFVNESTESGQKIWKIKGPFMQAETKNRNGRIYTRPIIEREVNNYKRDRIQTNRAMGELDHPPTPQINLDRVSHLVEDLYMDGVSAIGTAKILDTPMGKTASALLSGGVKLGVSSRGVGTLKGETVNSDYRLICIDIVGDPSALNAYVDGIYENTDYIIDGNKIVEAAVDNFKKSLSVNGTRKLMYDLKRFLNDIK